MWPRRCLICSSRSAFCLSEAASLRALFLEQRQRGLGVAQLLAAVGAERDAPAERAAHRAHDAEVAGRAVVDEAGAVRLVFGDLGELRAREVGQLEVVEEVLHELFLGEVEDEVVLALAGVARLAAAAAAAAAAVGPLDAVAGHVFAVARMHGLALAAVAVAEQRLAQVALGDVDVLAVLEVADAAAVDRAAHRLADLVLVAAQEALAVADRLVLAGQPSVDDLLQHVVIAVGAVGAADPMSEVGSAAGCAQVLAKFRTTCARAGTTRTAGAPASACSPSAPCG